MSETAMFYGAKEITHATVRGVTISVYSATQECFEDFQGFRFHAEGGDPATHKAAIQTFLRAANDMTSDHRPKDVPSNVWLAYNRLPDGTVSSDDIRLIDGRDAYVRAGSAIEAGDARLVADLTSMIQRAATKLTPG